MINEFENFDSITGWVASTGAAIHGLCSDKTFIAGNLSNSLMLKFSTQNAYCTKTFGTAISTVGYSQLVLHVGSRINRSNDYRKLSDFLYKISLGTGKEYYLPTPQTFCDITIDISDITSIEQIKITYLGTEEDYLFLSYGCLVEDDMPLNIYLGIKKEIDAQLLAAKNTFEVGTITGAAGDKQLTFTTAPSWIDRYAAVRIAGTADEIHHISDTTETDYKFSSLFAGSSLLASHSSKKVYLHPVCEYGKKHKEIVIPSINIWGVTPEPQYLDNDMDLVLDTWKDGKIVSERPVGRFFKYDIMIDCEARSDEVLMLLSRCVKKAIQGNYRIWCGGKAVQIEINGIPVEEYPTDTLTIIPKIQFMVAVVVREEVASRVSLPATTDIDVFSEIV